MEYADTLCIAAGVYRIYFYALLGAFWLHLSIAVFQIREDYKCGYGAFAGILRGFAVYVSFASAALTSP